MGWLLIADVVAIAVLFAAAMWLRSATADGRLRRTARRPDLEQRDSEPDTTLAHAEATVTWAEGTRSDWDRHVRPILAREFGHLAGGRRSGTAASQRATGELLFGAELWPLVDPLARFTNARERPGPGRKALAQILDKLEGA